MFCKNQKISPLPLLLVNKYTVWASYCMMTTTVQLHRAGLRYFFSQLNPFLNLRAFLPAHMITVWLYMVLVINWLYVYIYNQLTSLLSTIMNINNIVFNSYLLLLEAYYCWFFPCISLTTEESFENLRCKSHMFTQRVFFQFQDELGIIN